MVVVTLANCHLDEYQRQKVLLFFRRKVYICLLVLVHPDLLGGLSLVSAAEWIAH